MKTKAVSAAWVVIFFVWLAGTLASAQSLGDLARKAREEKKQETRKAARVFTNDNLPSGPGAAISVVGTPPPPPKVEGEEAGGEGEAKPAAAKEAEKPKEPPHDEAYWKARSAEQRARISASEKELDLLQRELNLMQQQYYSDPNEALREQNTRSQVNAQVQKINDKRDEIAKLRQGLAQLEDELRREGGDPGWLR